MTLGEYACEYQQSQAPSWKNVKHAAQCCSSSTHPGDLLKEPISRQRIEAVYDRAIIAGIVDANPAASLKRALRAPAKKRHFASTACVWQLTGVPGEGMTRPLSRVGKGGSQPLAYNVLYQTSVMVSAMRPGGSGGVFVERSRITTTFILSRALMTSSG